MRPKNEKRKRGEKTIGETDVPTRAKRSVEYKGVHSAEGWCGACDGIVRGKAKGLDQRNKKCAHPRKAPEKNKKTKRKNGIWDLGRWCWSLLRLSFFSLASFRDVVVSSVVSALLGIFLFFSPLLTG